MPRNVRERIVFGSFRTVSDDSFLFFKFQISNFNWPGMGPALERWSAPLGRNVGRPRRCPSPGQLKFEILKLRIDSSEMVRKQSETIRKRSENGPERSENDPTPSETVRKRSETVRNRPKPSENGPKLIRNRPKPFENDPKRPRKGRNFSEHTL